MTAGFVRRFVHEGGGQTMGGWSLLTTCRTDNFPRSKNAFCIQHTQHTVWCVFWSWGVVCSTCSKQTPAAHETNNPRTWSKLWSCSWVVPLMHKPIGGVQCPMSNTSFNLVSRVVLAHDQPPAAHEQGVLRCLKIFHKCTTLTIFIFGKSLTRRQCHSNSVYMCSSNFQCIHMSLFSRDRQERKTTQGNPCNKRCYHSRTKGSLLQY